MEPALFSFGTLMDADLLELVCQQSLDELQLEPAQVQHYRACWVVDDHFPVLVEQEGALTQGTIIRGLSALSIQRIQFFEGGEFVIKPLMVVNTDGQQEHVNYFADTQKLAVTDHLWELADWQRLSKSHTLPKVKRYMQNFGKMSIEEADAFW